MRLLEPTEHDRWDEFVAGTDSATLFHTAWWHRAWAANVDVYAGENGGGEIEGGIAVHVGRRLGVRAIRRPPLTPVNGPVFRLSGKARRSSRYSQNRKQINAAIASCPAVGFYDFSLFSGMDDVMPFLWNGYEPLIGYTYVIPPGERDDWRANMSDMNRRNLDKARREVEENGLSIEVGAPVGEVLELLVDTADTKGFAFRHAAERIPAWWREVVSRGAGSLYMVRDPDGEPACATLTVRDSRTAYYIAGGMRKETRSKSRLNLILFERMIGDAHEMGLDFDFEGSTLTGVERFFRGWGGELRASFRMIKIPSPTAYAMWNLYQYFRNGHRKRKWVSHP